MVTLDFDKLITQHCQIIDGLSLAADNCDEGGDLTSLLRNTGLALGNLGKLRTLQKKETVVEEDDGIDEMIAAARETAQRINDKEKI